MISREEAEIITGIYSIKDKNEILWEIYKSSIEDTIVLDAKKGRTYTYINQNRINYLSNLNFKRFAVHQLKCLGYTVTEERNNAIRLSWK